MRTFVQLVSASLCFLLTMGSAHATGGSAVIASGEGNSTAHIEYLDNMLSTSMSNEGDGKMILRDGKIYVISGGTVIDASNMMSMLGQQAPSTSVDGIQQFKGLRSTGQSETVAGIKGDVHVLDYIDIDGVAHSTELVLSKDPRAVALANAMLNMGRTMAKLANIPPPADEAKFQAALQGRGVLRADQDFKVVSFGIAPSVSHFELPSAPQAMPSLEGLFGGQTGTKDAAEPETSGGGFLGGMFGQKAGRQQDRIEQRTDQEVDEATDSMVDKALDKAFGKLFGK